MTTDDQKIEWDNFEQMWDLCLDSDGLTKQNIDHDITTPRTTHLGATKHEQKT
jgi:hypothetical protein